MTRRRERCVTLFTTSIYTRTRSQPGTETPRVLVHPPHLPTTVTSRYSVQLPPFLVHITQVSPPLFIPDRDCPTRTCFCSCRGKRHVQLVKPEYSEVTGELYNRSKATQMNLGIKFQVQSNIEKDCEGHTHLERTSNKTKERGQSII